MRDNSLKNVEFQYFLIGLLKALGKAIPQIKAINGRVELALNVFVESSKIGTATALSRLCNAYMNKPLNQTNSGAPAEYPSLV
jgi:hypothetical protein